MIRQQEVGVRWGYSQAVSMHAKQSDMSTSFNGKSRSMKGIYTSIIIVLFNEGMRIEGGARGQGPQDPADLISLIF